MEMLEALRTLRDEGPVLPKVGICSNLQILGVIKVAPALMRVFPYWDEFSGDSDCPVRFKYGCPLVGYRAAQHGGWMWSGEYGAARRRLLDFLIEYFEEDER